MEAIAREAGVAKPTLYAHFPTKDAVFLAILEALLAAKVQAFEAGLAGDEPLPERVGRAIAAEFGVLADALRGSPHAQELFAEHRVAAELMQSSSAVVAAQLEAALVAGGIPEAGRLTRILLDASFGLAQRAIGAEALGDDLKLLARSLLPDASR